MFLNFKNLFYSHKFLLQSLYKFCGSFWTNHIQIEVFQKNKYQNTNHFLFKE
jgi:hypothetical protein